MAKQEQKTTMIIEQREELVISSKTDEPPKSKTSHFLKPILNPKNHDFIPKHPSFILPSKQPNIKVQFKGSPIPQKDWHLWVGNMQQIHEFTWKKVGIFNAIKGSTYNIKKDNDVIIGLAKYWCDETKSFIFSWGECSVTLEDVMILGGFSVLGENVQTPFYSKEVEDIEKKLMGIFPKKRKNLQGRIEQQVWIDCFMDFGGELEHIALIVLWLSRYVFCKKYYCQISPNVVPIAISLVRGTRIALAPAVLASLYHDMSLLKHKMVSCVNSGSNNHVVWAPMQLVQLWAWERFPKLGPNPISLFRGEPRLARWQNLKRGKNDRVVMDFEVLGESFVWRPYALSIENWELPQFYCDEDRWVLMSSEVGEELLSFARCLRPCELVGLDCIEQYLPHRVALQFGLDQDIPCSIPRLNDRVELAWNTYDVSLDGVKLYLAPRLLQGDETIRYFTWSRTTFCLGTGSNSVFNQQRMLRRRSREMRVTRSQDSDVVLLDSREFALACLPSSLFGVALASRSVRSVGEVEGLVKTATSGDKRTPTLGNNYADNSECLPSQCPRSANNKSVQNVEGNVQDSNKGALPCSSLSDTVAVGSALVGSIGEKYVERMSSEKNCCLNRICDDDENTPLLSLENAIEKTVMGVDTLMEQLGRCREDCVNMSSNKLVDNSVEAKYSENTPPCNNDTSPTKSHDNCYQGLPFQSTQRDADEVASLTNSPMAESMKELGKIHEDTNCIETGISTRLLEVACFQDDILAANDNDHVSKVEPDKKKLCLVDANCVGLLASVSTASEQGKGAKSASAKSGNGTRDGKVVIIDDDDDEGEKAQNGFDPVEVLGSKLLQFNASISKLEKVVSELQAKKLKSKVE